MDVYRRYFRVESGPLIEAVKEATEINQKARREYLMILQEIGARHEYYHNRGRLVGIIFDGKVDTCLFKLAKHGWYPKKKCKAGKDLAERLKAVKTKDIQEALSVVALPSHPTIFSGTTCYYPMLVVVPDNPITVYVSVPWHDADPEKVEQYKKDHAAGTCGDTNMDSITWKPTPEMKEIKKWEFERHITEWNEKVKAEEKAA